MLDAAHGESVTTIIRLQREHVAPVEMKACRVVRSRQIGRGRPQQALVSDACQGPRRFVAVARSRGLEAIAGMGAAERGTNNTQFRMQNS